MNTLTSRQTRQLERDLLALRKSALRVAHEELTRATGQSYADIAGDVPDFGDQATAASVIHYDNEVARRHAESMREIDDALVRMKADRFGHCVECGGDIGFARLKAFPTAKRCVSCQDLRERTYAVTATPTL